jgi:hypothetical protein
VPVRRVNERVEFGNGQVGCGRNIGLLARYREHALRNADRRGIACCNVMEE